MRAPGNAAGCRAHARARRVPGLVWRRVSGLGEVQAALRDGWRGRATAATALNAASSRSHALVSVKVQGRHDGKHFTSLLHLVDLAGDCSERSTQCMSCAWLARA